MCRIPIYIKYPEELKVYKRHKQMNDAIAEQDSVFFQQLSSGVPDAPIFNTAQLNRFFINYENVGESTHVNNLSQNYNTSVDHPGLVLMHNIAGSNQMVAGSENNEYVEQNRVITPTPLFMQSRYIPRLPITTQQVIEPLIMPPPIGPLPPVMFYFPNGENSIWNSNAPVDQFANLNNNINTDIEEYKETIIRAEESIGNMEAEINMINNVLTYNNSISSEQQNTISELVSESDINET
jgi:hypothetical protein